MYKTEARSFNLYIQTDRALFSTAIIRLVKCLKYPNSIPLSAFSASSMAFDCYEKKVLRYRSNWRHRILISFSSHRTCLIPPTFICQYCHWLEFNRQISR
jgi:hypothetical protein